MADSSKWKVTATYQSTREDAKGNRVNEPVSSSWLKEGTAIAAAATVASLLEQATEETPITEILSITTERLS